VAAVTRGPLGPNLRSSGTVIARLDSTIVVARSPIESANGPDALPPTLTDRGNSHVPAYVAAQLVGGLLAAGLIRSLYPDLTAVEAENAVTPTEARSA